MAGTECVWREATRWKSQEERLRAGQGVLLEGKGCFCMYKPYAYVGYLCHLALEICGRSERAGMYVQVHYCEVENTPVPF